MLVVAELTSKFWRKCHNLATMLALRQEIAQAHTSVFQAIRFVGRRHSQMMQSQSGAQKRMIKDCCRYKCVVIGCY